MILCGLVELNGRFKRSYHISQLVCALRLVNFAGRILLYGPLKFKAVIVAKMLCDLLPSFLHFFWQVKV